MTQISFTDATLGANFRPIHPEMQMTVIQKFFILSPILPSNNSDMNHRDGQDWLTYAVFCLFALLVAYASAETHTMHTVKHVDVTKYLGTWHEIARYPNRFEESCDADVTAEYSMRKDGRLSVVNHCRRKDGSRKEARGWAKIADTTSNAKLRVTFFWPFFGDYWILELGDNYEYAVIGEPSRKYLWILSREAKISDEHYAAICAKLQAHGYDPSRLIKTKLSQ